MVQAAERKDSNKQSKDANFAFVGNNEIALGAISASDWLADSVATMHIAQNKHHFTSYVKEPSVIEGLHQVLYYGLTGMAQLPLNSKQTIRFIQ